MTNKRKGIPLLLVVLLVPQIIVLTYTTPTDAWGLSTHNYIVTEAMNAITDVNWSAAFDYYSPELLEGAIAPDQQWQDWDNHLYYPETRQHNAPNAAAKWFEFARNNFTAENWELGFFAAGVMSHYAVDPCIPVHTDEWWPGHSAYEEDINAHLDSLTIVTPTETLVGNVSQLVVDSATYSHQYYDDIYLAYPDETATAIESNATIKAITEDVLSLAVNACLSLFFTLTNEITPPEINMTFTHVALIDYAHSNDYIDYSGQNMLTSIEGTLERHGFEVRHQTSAITAESLIGVDLFIATCGFTEYTADELSALSAWAATGEKSMVLTGRGDYSQYQDVARPNQILEAIGSNIRINDDNVYMEGTYQPWYIDLYDIPAPEATLNLTFGVSSITLFSPSSLYFLDERPVLPIIFCDPTGYQTDQMPPTPVRIYDETKDGVNGDQIPLIAVEEIGSLRLLVTGTTIFSNYDYGKDFDNVQFIENFLEWAKDTRSERNVPNIDEIGPWIKDITWTPENPNKGDTITVSANVTDVSGVSQVSLKYTTSDGTQSVIMTAVGNGVYKANITISLDATEITIMATDFAENTAVRGTISILTSEISTTTSTTQSETTPELLSIDPLILGGVIGIVALVCIVVAIKRR